MENKIITSVIHINHEFMLPETKQVCPPGDYTISQEDELIEGVSWLAYRRTGTFIDIPSIGTSKTQIERHAIASDELTAIIEWDR
ncbi:hypothetical protein [Cohaesibacter celericrescens]|uniref:Uncharacterized protein n=1 Tax=Cohaesibacter celericrescens TaxID=2067669 RepID=A0A2N5XKY6_9HYPH|nr:hypothetical protein [Cohaesibacter celericrescens]PLW75201.1 hypothetical protein C0081_20490 [Cohaesibacter celericrescens]